MTSQEAENKINKFITEEYKKKLKNKIEIEEATILKIIRNYLHEDEEKEKEERQKKLDENVI